MNSPSRLFRQLQHASCFQLLLFYLVFHDLSDLLSYVMVSPMLVGSPKHHCCMVLVRK